MISIIFKLCVVFLFITPTLQQQSARKYSVEQEAFKLYAQDFQTVLKRFRRTPDYLKILQDKMRDLKSSTKEISLQIFHYYFSQMDKRVNETLPASTSTHNENYQQNSPDRTNLRRQMDYETTVKANDETSEKKIQNLDNYKVFFSTLSVAEKNSMRDLGFKIAGEIIQKILSQMSPSKGLGGKLIDGSEDRDDTLTTTTEDPGYHEVTSYQHQDSVTNDQQQDTDGVSPENFYRNRRPKTTIQQSEKVTAA